MKVGDRWQEVMEMMAMEMEIEMVMVVEMEMMTEMMKERKNGDEKS